MTMLKSKVAVSATLWKVVLVLDRPGIEPNNVTEKMSRTINLVVPNQQGVNSKPWKEYVTSVDEVERLTGYDFFENVAASVKGTIESKVDSQYSNTTRISKQIVRLFHIKSSTEHHLLMIGSSLR